MRGHVTSTQCGNCFGKGRIGGLHFRRGIGGSESRKSADHTHTFRFQSVTDIVTKRTHGDDLMTMKTFVGVPRRQVLKAMGRLAASFLVAVSGLAQQPATRITTKIDNNERTPIVDSHPPTAKAGNEIGRVPPGTRLQGMSVVFRRSDAQETALRTLLVAQQNPSSTFYHKWLTPDDFADQFGAADADIAKVESWLEQQGFSVDQVSRSKNSITFSGTVGQAEAAFTTELHYYKANGKTNYAPSVDLSVPSALSSVVNTITNLSTFRPRPHVRFKTPQLAPRPNFTSSQSGNHYLSPGDVSTIYDIKSAYNAGYTGIGQSIAIVGQSAVAVSDIESFQRAAGLTTKDPTLVLVPNSGTAAVSSGDEAESDLDLEYSGAIAKDAAIYFVYVGNSSNYSTWDSIQYAVDNRVAPIISNSYGNCETELSSADYSTLQGILEQAASQGQTIVTASGDSGSTDCYPNTGLTTAQRTALAVDFPASSQYVTGMGGTEFPSADISSSNTTYWESASGSDVVSSALSYIPEQVWNDDSSTNGLSSGGGGVSALTARPSWQTGVVGIPSGSYRLVPDISLDASPNNAGYLYCSSDSNATGVTGSCSNGFRDSSDAYLTVAGGTSFAAPIFAGMLAIINQRLNSTGQGVINSTLYTMAANSTTYASAFHDISSGSNKCTAGSSYCSSAGESEYPSTTGYDEATGLGSVDMYNLLTAWPTTSASSLQGSKTTLSATTTSPASGAADTISVMVVPDSSSIGTTPTGTVTIVVDGTTKNSSLALSNGSAKYTFSSTSAGSHVIEAIYSGDSIFAGSTGATTVTIGSSSTSTYQGTFSLSATNVTIAAGNSGTSTITITPLNGYTGTIGWSVSGSSTISNSCYSITDTSISGTSAVTTKMTIYTKSSDCSSSSVTGSGKRNFASAGPTSPSSCALPPLSVEPVQAAVAMSGLLFVWLIGRGLRRRRVFLALFVLVTVGLANSGCSSSSDTPRGSYQLTITGTDKSSSSITASTTMTLTVD